MADVNDILLKQMELERAQALHVENQRATLSNMILVLSAAGLGFLAQRGLGTSSLAVTIPLIGLGWYGALSTARLYERFLHHYDLQVAMQVRLDAQLPELQLIETIQQTNAGHDVRHPRIRRIRLHILWESLHLAIAGIGLILTAIALF
ncbi:hypothetical protein [Nocardia sp. NPDC057030]|uniref:hypothetical protein n=1 Tax=unclassified Nocardia TaxID=2637762 RepID=UPI0036315BC2